ncbi:tRNA nucleotidyltransferase/poly(A) polymerase family protein [Coleofasciculus chthonoplastes PCC 7420]|uniref:tRNA nucleotidyltransferase/poly(A) polymerase family protein n=1 Tax=Coleofasciculus chthonoplastes PCC 7420 TaxID=118168 RepID=B4VUI3_9CYAN|nr:CBS domain-containing protein [Coleofasciculus chthonoplastes]EDX74519.1 tRNA nucleotidyltransferase/poly(A) polymerase family protein [Coleofasciculus chthonoplastes PCC 7420]
MDLILCHTISDFDALGAAVGLTRLKTGAKLVLTGGAHPAVRDFLALHRDEYALIERRSVKVDQIHSLVVVDTQKRDRLGKAAQWFDLPYLTAIELYDHHGDTDSDIPATFRQVEPVGATTTLIVEQLQQTSIQLTTAEATVMALGIHVDTGSLTFDQTTPRDAMALAWVMAQGANIRQIADYVDPGLSPQLQQLLTTALEQLQSENYQGNTLSWVFLKTQDYVPGLSSLASRLVDLTESDALLLAAEYGGDVETCHGTSGSREAGEDVSESNNQQSKSSRLTIIGRSRIPGTNLNALLQPLGGGGHSQAAAVTLRHYNPPEVLPQLVDQFKEQIPQPLSALELMSSPVRTIRPDTTVGEAQRILLRYGHSGLSVVDEHDQLIGIISRRDIDLALHHGLGHAPVKGYMTRNLKTITPQTSLPEIESLMVTYDIGRLPVLENGQLVGIVTRTDVLRQVRQDQERWGETCPIQMTYPSSRLLNMRERLAPALWQLLTQAAQEAQERGWHLYLVGGAVRDVLLADESQPLLLEDVDLVVDGFHRAADVGAGVTLAKALRERYPNARLDVHGAFQTAALLWHNDPVLDSLWIDIATARTEFYPYPAANPEVEASSIRQDLYRRDFTINAMAARLTGRRGEALPLLDFFGGMLDLRSRQIRVLHANSFIEDPTRIYRAVRFAVRLGFELEPQTQDYIQYALESGVYERSLGANTRAPALETRLKAELKYILEAPYWQRAFQLIGSLGALRCLHPSLKLDPLLWWRVRLIDRWLRRFDPDQTLKHWQMRLEVLIAHLEPQERGKVAENLQLPIDSIERLQHLGQAQTEVVESLPQCQRPSEVVLLLRQYKLPTLVLIAVHSYRAIRRKLWHYFTNLATVQAPLNGNDLKRLGYKPGPHYKEMLDALLTATLDGVIQDEADAQAFLEQHYPRST